MAMTPEGRVKHEIKKYLNSIPGLWWYMPVPQGMGRAGVPDIICCHKGTFIGIEVKAPNKETTLTENQLRELNGIEAAGGVAFVATSVAHVMLVLSARGVL